MINRLLTRKVYETKKEKRTDFWKGFGGWFLFNIIFQILLSMLSIALWSVKLPKQRDTFIALIGFIPLPFNIITLIYFAFFRNRIALGMLAAFGVSLLIATILTVACFVVIFSAF